MRLANYLNQDSPTIFTDEPIYFTRIAEAEVVLLLIYAKSKTDNIALPFPAKGWEIWLRDFIGSSVKFVGESWFR